MEQIRSRLSGIEDKTEELDHSNKDKEKILRKHVWNTQHI
jgi:hypothetical protein